MTQSMSLKATAKEFIPSFNPPVIAPTTGGATLPSISSSCATGIPNQEQHLQQKHPQQHQTLASNNRLKGPHFTTRKQNPQQQQQQQPQHQHGGNDNPKLLQRNHNSGSLQGGRSLNNKPHSHEQQKQHQHQQPSRPSNGAKSSPASLSNASSQNTPSKRSNGAGPGATGPTTAVAATTTATVSGSAQGAGSGFGSGAKGAAATSSKPHPPKRSGSGPGHGHGNGSASSSSKTSGQGGIPRKGSIDHHHHAGPGSSSASSSSAATVSTAAGSISAATSAGAGGIGSDIIPGMEPTAFICLTDVIHPVRHVVKDGVSTMEHGSNAYLDWIVRSLKEYEEITLIGMEAAIPDIIALVLRAGKQGIGYQEIRTFTTQDGLGGNKSCLQFRMRRDQGYIALEKRPPRS